jgi:hypothetical protein
MKLNPPVNENQRLILRSYVSSFDIWYEIWEPSQNGTLKWNPNKDNFNREELEGIVLNNHYQYVSLPDIVRELDIKQVRCL